MSKSNAPYTPEDAAERERIEAIRKRLDAATPGPWRVRTSGGTNRETPEPPEWTIDGSDGYRIRAEDVYPGHGEDVYFIAHAREDVPFLLDALEKAGRAITRLQTIEECKLCHGDGEYWDGEHITLCSHRAQSRLEGK